MKKNREERPFEIRTIICLYTVAVRLLFNSLILEHLGGGIFQFTWNESQLL